MIQACRARARPWSFLAALILLALPGRSDDRPPHDPRSAYKQQEVEGWRVLVHERLFDDERRELRERALKLLASHLYQIGRVVPAEALARLRAVPIWIEVAHPRHPCMCYHPSPDWLREHDMNPEKAGAVEIANVENFLSWTIEQPWMVLHELAHAYHHQVLKVEHAGIRAAFEKARAARSYDNVLRRGGQREPAYALSNPQEYFAELSEAFFGTNDFYPFVRPELAEHDPEMFALLKTLWGESGAK